MLWYKAWLETRTRFWISLVGVTGLCSYSVYGPDNHAAKLEFYYFDVLHSGHQTLMLAWLVAMTLLMMGGLVQESAVGESSFTLALPVSRTRLMAVRICTGLIQAAAMAAVAWAGMFAVLVFTSPARPLAQIWFYAVLLLGGGIVFAGVAVLVSSLVGGQYTAPMVSLGILAVCADAPTVLDFLNPLRFMSGRAYTGPSHMLAGPLPWAHVIANVCVAAAFIYISVQVVRRRDFS